MFDSIQPILYFCLFYFLSKFYYVFYSVFVNDSVSVLYGVFVCINILVYNTYVYF